MPTPVANTLHVNDSDQHLSAYLSSRIRKRIERDYYQRVSDQAHLVWVATNPVFLANPLQHVALYSDHGPVHARDVATQITAVLESVNGVAIPFRDSMRLEFMKGYGVLLAYAHDIGMKDFTAFGRAMHPEYAAQEVFTDGWDDIIDAAWNDNSGNVGWRLVMLGDALGRDPKLVLRELLSLAVGHSKSKVPIVILNDPQRLRTLMLKALSTELHHLHFEQRIEKVRRAAFGALSNASFSDRFEHQKREQEAEREHQQFSEANPELTRVTTVASRRYSNFESEAFGWLCSENRELREFVLDVLDTVRTLRVADALRQRGSTLRTSAAYRILVDQNTANAVFALEKGSGETFLLESTSIISAGEANISATELTGDGALHVCFQRGAFASREACHRAAHNAAVLVDDIWRDVVDSFTRSSEGGGADSVVTVLLEHTGDNIEFADMVLDELRAINPKVSGIARTVPSLANVDDLERKRYLAAQSADWSDGERQKCLLRIARSGHPVKNIDAQKAFQDVRIATVMEGQVLVQAGAPPSFVYIAMGDGLSNKPLGGYRSYAIKAWTLIANTRAIRGAAQASDVYADRDVKVLIVPKEVYLKSWHATYSVEEFCAFLPSAYAEERASGCDEVVEILWQMAMVDATLDDTELRFVTDFAEHCGLEIDTEAVRKARPEGGQTDLVQLRETVIGYLAHKPPHSQVARLKDMLTMLVKVDQTVSSEEDLIVKELNGLLDIYLFDDGVQLAFAVLLVPQSREQDQAMASLFANFARVDTAGGVAYVAGRCASREFADVLCGKYRALNFFTVVNDEDLETQAFVKPTN